MVNVTSIQPATVFAWFMFFMVVRRIVLLVMSLIIGHDKPFIFGSRAPEDRILKRGQIEPSSSSSSSSSSNNSLEYTKDLRILKIIGNDAENDSYFFILLLSTSVLSDTLSGDCTRTVIYGTIYLFFRLCYTITYILALQPWRTIIFYLSLACTFACSFDLLITTSRRSN